MNNYSTTTQLKTKNRLTARKVTLKPNSPVPEETANGRKDSEEGDKNGLQQAGLGVVNDVVVLNH